jgi:hypothetical protein
VLPQRHPQLQATEIPASSVSEPEPRASAAMLVGWFLWLALVWGLLAYAGIVIAHQL